MIRSGEPIMAHHHARARTVYFRRQSGNRKEFNHHAIAKELLNAFIPSSPLCSFLFLPIGANNLLHGGHFVPMRWTLY
jgi:hypothetical protein